MRENERLKRVEAIEVSLLGGAKKLNDLRLVPPALLPYFFLASILPFFPVHAQTTLAKRGLARLAQSLAQAKWLT